MYFSVFRGTFKIRNPALSTLSENATCDFFFTLNFKWFDCFVVLICAHLIFFCISLRRTYLQISFVAIPNRIYYVFVGHYTEKLFLRRHNTFAQ